MGTQAGSLTFADNGSWGIGPFLRRSGAEPGDYLLLSFDLKERKAIAWIGDVDLLDGLEDPGYPELLARSPKWSGLS